MIATAATQMGGKVVEASVAKTSDLSAGLARVESGMKDGGRGRKTYVDSSAAGTEADEGAHLVFDALVEQFEPVTKFV